MKTTRIILMTLLCLILFFSNCSSEKDEEDYSLRVKTMVSVCVTHEGMPVGAGVFLWVLLYEYHDVSLGTRLVDQNITTNESGCISLVTPYYDFCNNCSFEFHASLPEPNVGQTVYLNYEEALAGATESDDGHGKIYTWNVNLVLSY